MRLWPALDLVLPDAALVPDGFRDRLSVALDELSPTALEDSSSGIRVHFGTDADRDAARARLDAGFHHEGLRAHPVDLPDEDWARRSQAGLRAVHVGDLVVAPPWDVPAGLAPDQLIVVEPSMGFGTGHHATTRLCLLALQRLPIAGKTVVDVGTGSGVLAMAAARRGARRVTAIDDDPEALASARDNLQVNGLMAVVDLRLGDFQDGSIPACDLVLANLTGALLVAAREHLEGTLAPGGTLVLSGFLPDEAPSILSAFGALVLEDLTMDEGWGCALFTRRASSATL